MKTEIVFSDAIESRIPFAIYWGRIVAVPVRAPAAIARVLLARRCVGVERGGRHFIKRKKTNAPRTPGTRLAAAVFR